MREVAAYLLDHEHFAGVPPTALVSCHDSGPLPSEYSKIGSLQVGALCWSPAHPVLVSRLPSALPWLSPIADADQAPSSGTQLFFLTAHHQLCIHACRRLLRRKGIAKSGACPSFPCMRCTRLRCWTCAWAIATAMEVAASLNLSHFSAVPSQVWSSWKLSWAPYISGLMPGSPVLGGLPLPTTMRVWQVWAWRTDCIDQTKLLHV